MRVHKYLLKSVMGLLALEQRTRPLEPGALAKGQHAESGDIFSQANGRNKPSISAYSRMLKTSDALKVDGHGTFWHLAAPERGAP
eukprot:6202448-Pleurochrysis_carterae.AAC.1